MWYTDELTERSAPADLRTWSTGMCVKTEESEVKEKRRLRVGVSGEESPRLAMSSMNRVSGLLNCADDPGALFALAGSALMRLCEVDILLDCAFVETILIGFGEASDCSNEV